MKLKVIIFSLFLMSFGVTGSNASKISHTMSYISDTVSIENHDLIYLLPSKDVYEVGEDMWFKAWLLDRSSLGLSGRSRTLYLRIYSPGDSIVWDEMYPIKDGRADGHVYVGEGWKEGEYRMEAYAKSSFHNDSTEALHPRKIIVVDRIAQIDSLTRALSAADSIAGAKSFRLDLLPEGGYLVRGLTCRVAFKATDRAGMPVDVTGAVTEDGKPVADVRSTHDGMGYFYLRPASGKEYRLKLSSGEEYCLPEIKDNGTVMSLTGQNDRFIGITVRRAGGIGPESMTLSAKMRGVTCCTAEISVSDSVRVNLPMRYFPRQGIAEVTLSDGEGRPVAERLVYVNPQRKLNISVKTDKDRYGRVSHGKLSVHAEDEDGKPVQAELCVAILDKWYKNDRARETILSHCMLSEQVRGNIHNPAYYFDEGNTDRMQALDLLLMTQGWRRFTWMDSVGGDAAGDENGEVLSDCITGRSVIKRNRKKKEIEEQPVKILSHDGKTKMLWTDSDGNFIIHPDVLDEFRGGYIYISPLMKAEGLKTEIEIDSPVERIDGARRNKEMFMPLFRQPEEIGEKDYEISTGLGAYALRGVTVKANKKKIFTDKMMGRLDSLAKIQDVGGWLCRHKDVFGDWRYYINDYILGKSHTFCWPGLPDSIPQDGGIYYIPHSKKMKTIYIAPKFSEKELMRRNNILRTKGYYAKREFYQPDDNDLRMNVVDPRNTLLWSPSVITDEKGNAEIPFVTSDDTGTFLGIVEGTNGFGLLGSKQIEFIVQK
ncbi:MAG: hypothetical protein IJ624_05845 [Prevotella sp.]|nr:hypothetical protein [Prevotella sp.]